MNTMTYDNKDARFRDLALEIAMRLTTISEDATIDEVDEIDAMFRETMELID